LAQPLVGRQNSSICTHQHWPRTDAQDKKPATGGQNNIALTTKTIARMAIPNPFMKAVSPMSGEEPQAANDNGVWAGMPLITDPDDDDDSK